MRNPTLPALALTTMAVFAANTFAATETKDFRVVFKVNKACSVTQPQALDLGSLDSTSSLTATGQTSLTVNCSKKTPYQISMRPSGSATNGTGSLKAQNVAPMTGNTATIAYALFSNAAGTQAWGSADNTVGADGTGPQETSYTVYGKITGTVDVPPDEYEDTVQVTVTY